MSVLSVTDQSIHRILSENQRVLVDFWNPYCAPCKIAANVMEDLSQTMGNHVIFTKMQVDQNPAFPSQLQIRAVPSFVIFEKGQPIDQMVGFRSKDELVRFIRRAIA
ncbi:thioredoxin family protein [Marininema halotolerans]|uniref:Thioredoxin n=1 Tax=Marininema halotolerans TaxID=1155944 RepID=A0A1I6NS74_9BACL|nr:thioredoxin domain-containing protein [Marininema halotolerans]SFS30754.1 thioredoxin 1 [Marininema halotolerans]